MIEASSSTLCLSTPTVAALLDISEGHVAFLVGTGRLFSSEGGIHAAGALRLDDTLTHGRVSIREAANILGMSEGGVRTLVSTCRLTPLRKPGSITKVPLLEVRRIQGGGEEMVRVSKAAKMLNVSGTHIRRLIKSGRLVAYRPTPRTIRVALSGINALIAKKTKIC
jgi:excisionase family DNA binding protein